MFKQYIILLWLLLGVMIAPALAQPGQSTAWKIIENGAVQVSLPQDWNITDDVSAPNALLIQAPNPDVSLSITLRMLDFAIPLDEFALDTLREYTTENGYTLISVIPVVLPIGEAQRFESLRVVRGVRLHMVQYFILLDNTLITLQGIAPDDPTLDFAPYLEIFDRTASTLRVNDARFIAPPTLTDATGVLSLWLPPEWDSAVRDNAVLTFAEPAYKAVFTVTYRRLETAPLLVELAQSFLEAYEAQQITVEAFDWVLLPAGEAYRARLANVPAETGDGRTILTKQYQFILLRGTLLVVMNAGSETIYFDTVAPMLLRMADTLEITP